MADDTQGSKASGKKKTPQSSKKNQQTTEATTQAPSPQNKSINNDKGGDKIQPSASSPKAESKKNEDTTVEDLSRGIQQITVSGSTEKLESPPTTTTTDSAPSAETTPTKIDSKSDAAPESKISLELIADGIKKGKYKNIIVMSGAGISVSAGIPDFRTPGTGLYDNLQKYNLPEPTAIFEIGFFKQNPKPFCTLAKELFPGHYCPTPTHNFIKVLEEKKVLLRNFTQNIDGLEFLAGVSEEKVVQAHGGFQTAHCLTCGEKYDSEFCKKAILADKVPTCKCGGIVKPDIVFFGESLPDLFWKLMKEDFPKCDCLIVMGTSLKVQPFASLINKVPKTAVRVLINREKVGECSKTPLKSMMRAMGINVNGFSDEEIEALADNLGLPASGFDFDSPSKGRDIFVEGDCDDGSRKFAKLLGWEEDLDRAIATTKEAYQKSLKEIEKMKDRS